jgi:hypothetical protein
MAAAMRLLLPFIAALMLVITGMTSVAHATEAPGGSAVGAELAIGHAPGDADEVPADADRDSPHHHSICHGHDLAAPVRVPAAPAFRAEPRLTHLAMVATMRMRAAETPHRPPIA